MDLINYFDKVVVINLKRRPERLAFSRKTFSECGWPFKEPCIFEAIDGKGVVLPHDWPHLPGSYGCLLSHRKVLEDSIKEGVENLLVIEDDVFFAQGFRQKIQNFIENTPPWDALMIGGYHLTPPIEIGPGVNQCLQTTSTHCYAVRGDFKNKLLERWYGGGKFNGLTHCDAILSEDPEMQAAHKVYAPNPFLATQNKLLASDVRPSKTNKRRGGRFRAR